MLIAFARIVDIYLDLANITLDIECELSSCCCLYDVICRFERNGTNQYHSRRDGFLSTHHIATNSNCEIITHHNKLERVTSHRTSVLCWLLLCSLCVWLAVLRRRSSTLEKHSDSQQWRGNSCARCWSVCCLLSAQLSYVMLCVSRYQWHVYAYVCSYHHHHNNQQQRWQQRLTFALMWVCDWVVSLVDHDWLMITEWNRQCCNWFGATCTQWGQSYCVIVVVVICVSHSTMNTQNDDNDDIGGKSESSEQPPTQAWHRGACVWIEFCVICVSCDIVVCVCDVCSFVKERLVESTHWLCIRTGMFVVWIANADLISLYRTQSAGVAYALEETFIANDDDDGNHKSSTCTLMYAVVVAVCDRVCSMLTLRADVNTSFAVISTCATQIQEVCDVCSVVWCANIHCCCVIVRMMRHCSRRSNRHRARWAAVRCVDSHFDWWCVLCCLFAVCVYQHHSLSMIQSTVWRTAMTFERE